MRYIIVAIALVYNLPLIIIYFTAKYLKKWIIEDIGQEICLDALYSLTFDRRRWINKDSEWLERFIELSKHLQPRTKLGRYIRGKFTNYVIRKNKFQQEGRK